MFQENTTTSSKTRQWTAISRSKMDDKAIPIAQTETERDQQDQKPNYSVATTSSKDGPSSSVIASDDVGNSIDRGAGTPISSSVGTEDRNIVKQQPQQQQNDSNAATTSAVGTTSPIGKSRIVLDADQIVPEITPPKPPSKCPLFCVFYSVFDIKIGPTVAYQCPPNFMDQTIDISTNQVHDILAQTFEELKVKHVAERQQQQQQEEEQQGRQKKEDTSAVKQSETEDTTQHQSNNSDDIPNNNIRDQSNKKPGDDKETDSSREATISQQQKTQQTDIREASNSNTVTATATEKDDKESIFDCTSEYIITGSELTGEVITLSTHALHVMTRPTQIINEKYQRNSLLFSIGFVLRRAADPRPFRPLISKLAQTLRSMEVESEVLSNPVLARRTIQPLLERVLMSLNSPRWECNFVLNKATALNLKLFHPPKVTAPKVRESEIPVLLRRDKQLQQYEWDLAINWVILHIDGITNARQISIKAEVDLEMVLACLRVLKHHGVIAVVDMFMYSNRYEFTERATAMLSGQEKKLLQDCVDYCLKHPTIHIVAPPTASQKPGGITMQNIPTFTAASGGNTDAGTIGSPKSPSQGSPIYFHQNGAPFLGPSSNNSPSSSYPPRGLTMLGASAGGGSHRSSNIRYAMMAANSLERDSNQYLVPSAAANIANATAAVQSKDGRQLKTALAELYCACSRHLSFGDLWLKMTMELPTSLIVPDGRTQQQQQHRVSSRSSLGVGTAGGSSSSTYQRNAGSRKNSLTDYDLSENEIVAFSPLEANLLDALRRGSTPPLGGDEKEATKQGSKINWNQVFSKFDHRRFFTFGIIHGLCVRVHDYPYFTGAFPTKRETRIQYNHSSSSSLIVQQNSYSLNSASAMSSLAESIRKQKKIMKQEAVEEKRFQIAKTAASMMDGTRCDDELACLLERSFQQLVDMVEKYAGEKVIHIYATAR